LQEEGRQSITIEQIQRRVAEHFDVRLADMTSKRRPASIAFPRQVAMYLARELTKASLNEIGDAFGGRDHGTVLHACKLVKKRMVEQDNIRQTISYIDSSLQRQGRNGPTVQRADMRDCGCRTNSKHLHLKALALDHEI